MARGPRFKTKTKVSSTRRRRSKPSRQRSPRVTRVSSFGGFLAKGVRTLTSFLPGQSVIKPLVDFGLKTFGLATAVSIADGTMDATVTVVGVGSCFLISLKDIIFNDVKLGVRSNAANGRHDLMTNFSDGKLLNLRIHVERSDPYSSSVGRWGIGFLPFRTAADESFYKSAANKVPGFRDLDDIPGAVIGTARTLDLNFRTKIGRDGILALPLPLASSVGMVMIAYDNVNRTIGGEVQAGEFACVVTISGAVMLSRPQPLCGWQQFNDAITDNLGGMDMSVLYSSGQVYNLKKVSKTQVSTVKNSLRVIGAQIVSSINPSLPMEIV